MARARNSLAVMRLVVIAACTTSDDYERSRPNRVHRENPARVAHGNARSAMADGDVGEGASHGDCTCTAHVDGLAVRSRG